MPPCTGWTVTSRSGSPIRRRIDLTEYDLDVLPDGTVRTQHRTRGACVLIDVAPDGAVTELTGPDLEVVGQTVVGDHAVVSFQSPTTAGDVGIVENGTIRSLTDFSAPLRDRGIVVPEEFSPVARDGYPLHGWVAMPKGKVRIRCCCSSTAARSPSTR